MIIGGVQSKVANEKGNLPFILSLMLRLRQYCDSPSLIPVDFLDQINNIRMGKTEWGQEMIDKLQLLLETADANNDECAICLETLQANTMVATECGHIFCRACVQAIVTKTCPLCRGKISAAKLMALQVKHEEGVGEEKFESPKIECIVRILKSTAPATKTVIFSQFTSMLRLIRERLGSEGIETDIYDGTMEKDKRSTCLTHFKKSPTANVLLMSLKCGGVGLNIVEASQVILVDPWW
jgi:SWI/SNF-related matrix-associated actin-dependent regulator of chromatin subfamily A3